MPKRRKVKRSSKRRAVEAPAASSPPAVRASEEPSPPSPPETPPAPALPEPLGMSAYPVAAAVAGLLAAWFAAGSMGLLIPPLRHALSWLALAFAVLAAWPGPSPGSTRFAARVGVLLAALLMTVPDAAAVNVMAVVLILAGLALEHESATRRPVAVAAFAAAALGLFRLMVEAMPAVWLAADGLGRPLGNLAGLVAGRELNVGATFGGIDFLVVMAVLYAGWLAATERPRLARGLYAAAVILAGHFVYLYALARLPDLVAALPDPVDQPGYNAVEMPVWTWADAARRMLPWNVPLLAAAIHATIAAMMFGWARWSPIDEGTAAQRPLRQNEPLRAALLVLAVLVPLLLVLAPGRSDVAETNVAGLQPSGVGWATPPDDTFGRDAARGCGMVPRLIESLGGGFTLWDEVPEGDLSGIGVLIVVSPNQPWAPGELDRIWSLVREGGSLLVAAGSRATGTAETDDPLTTLLEPTAIRVCDDTAVAAVPQWEAAQQALAHPACAGMLLATTGQEPLIQGPTLRIGWPARPLALGRYGFADPGSEAAVSGMATYVGGYRLGDLVLAAEQRVGKGRVVVLGDASVLENGRIFATYPFVGRLLGYLAHGSGNPQVWWRQLLGLAACVAMVVFFLWRPDLKRLAAAAVLLAASWTLCAGFSKQHSRVLPDGSAQTPNRLAYVDASHLETFSRLAWHHDGIDGLMLNLMRNGYLSLLMPELTEDRLDGAGLLISIAPARGFTERECDVVQRFVQNGGLLISTVGAEEAHASRPLLQRFQLDVPPSPVGPGEETREPEPVGMFFRRLKGYDTTVYLRAAWPVVSQRADPYFRFGTDGQLLTIVHQVEKGRVVLIGDTGFATNKNLENAEGRVGDAESANVGFWRWLLAYLVDRMEAKAKAEPQGKPAGKEAAG